MECHTQRRLRARERVRLLVAAACGEQEAPPALPHSEGRRESRNPEGFCTRSHPRRSRCPAQGPAPGLGSGLGPAPGSAEPPRAGAPPPVGVAGRAPGACCCDGRRPRPLLVHSRAPPRAPPHAPRPRAFCALPARRPPPQRAFPLALPPLGTPHPRAEPRPGRAAPLAPICSRRNGRSCA